MTYCVGVLLDKGLVLASDSRTNAGVDNIGIFRKMTVFEKPGERLVVLLTAGNLAITQATLTLLDEWTHSQDEEKNILLAPTFYRVARVVGTALREIYRLDGDALNLHKTEFLANFILGGQIKGERQRLFMIYAAGNFIEATPETPFFQIGEIKYGKPVFDRLLNTGMDLPEAAKLVLISFDSTMRSNISVGPPVDLLCYRGDSLKVETLRRLGEGDPYFTTLRRGWGEGLRRTFESIPVPELSGGPLRSGGSILRGGNW